MPVQLQVREQGPEQLMARCDDPYCEPGVPGGECDSCQRKREGRPTKHMELLELAELDFIHVVENEDLHKRLERLGSGLLLLTRALKEQAK